MRKLSLLLGTLGGALAGYVLSNDKLRHELAGKDAESAAKILGSHLAKDGKKIAKEVKTFVESDDVQKNFKKAKKYATEKLGVAQEGLEKMMKKGAKKAEKYAKQGIKEAKRRMK